VHWSGLLNLIVFFGRPVSVGLRWKLQNCSFYRAMHFSAKRGLAIACRQSVRLSVCPSVTLVDCDHIGWNSSKIISPLLSLGCSRNGYNGEPIGNHHRSFEWCHGWPPTTSLSPKMGFHMPSRYANGHISATGDPIHFVFGSRVG